MTEDQATDVDMFCRKCGYALVGLSANRCPECGRVFDPGDPSSYSTARSTGDRRLDAAVLVLAGYPLAAVTSLYLFWIDARLRNGFWPRPYDSVDDNMVLAWSSALLLLGFKPVLLVNALLVAMALVGRLERHCRGRVPAWLLMAVPLATWASAWYFLDWDAWRVQDWFWD